MPSGNKPISGFGDGVPVAGDYFVFESAGGVTLRIDFSILQGLLAAIGTPGRDAPFILAEEPAEPEEPLLVPGQKGIQGPVGPEGPGTNINTIIMSTLDGIDGEDAEPIPGKQGIPGMNGTIGVDGRQGAPILPDDPDPPDEPMMVPGQRGLQGVPGEGGGTNPNYDPGSFTLANREYKVMAFELNLSGIEEALLEGDSTLVII
jgi:hypothetical protein